MEIGSGGTIAEHNAKSGQFVDTVKPKTFYQNAQRHLPELPIWKADDECKNN